jgi:hypothetical protein
MTLTPQPDHEKKVFVSRRLESEIIFLARFC